MIFPFLLLFQTLPLSDSLRQSAEDGRVCFLCLKTKFGLFSRGVRCSMCCHLVCGKCTHTMRIPADHFTATPVLLLSPSQTSPGPHPVADTSLSQLGVADNCAGSAPTSPPSCRRAEWPASDMLNISTISVSATSFEPVSLPPVLDKYATLPRKTARRWSMITARTGEREKLEGCPLSVCTDCRQMVLQVGFYF